MTVGVNSVESDTLKSCRACRLGCSGTIGIENSATDGLT